MKILSSVFLIVVIVSAQHSIPFASTGNHIELSVANTSTVTLNSAEIVAENIPSWIKFATTKEMVTQLSSNESRTAAFTFSVDKSAPINKPHTLKFIISSPTGEKWTKEIAIQVSAPEKFELFQNYPNPFNPTTTISFQLPEDSKIKITVYNTLGQEVTTLFDGIHSAGYYQEVWNAHGVASGMYIYQIVTEMSSGKKEIARKTMLLIK